MILWKYIPGEMLTDIRALADPFLCALTNFNRYRGELPLGWFYSGWQRLCGDHGYSARNWEVLGCWVASLYKLSNAPP
jgi:hypothetical protein